MSSSNNDSFWGCLILIGFIVALNLIARYVAPLDDLFFALVHGFFYAIFVIGIVWGVSIAALNFILSLHHFTKRPSLYSSHGSSHGVEPARESYFYLNGDWWKNLKSLLYENYRRDVINIKIYWFFIRERWAIFFQSESKLFSLVYTVPFTVFMLLRLLTLFLGFLVFMPCIAIPLLAMAVALSVTFNIIAGILHLLERLVMFIRGIFVLCPYCSKKIGLPIYECPKCRSVHRSLSPSPRYGILYHVCQCGMRLPTTRLSGRTQLKSYCPNKGCHGELSKKTEDVRAITLAFIGGPSSGKSYLQAALIQRLIDWANNSSYKKCVPSFNQSGITQLLRAWQDQCTITTRDNMEPYGLDVRELTTVTSRRVYFYDPAGESFERINRSGNSAASHLYYRYLRCAIIVIDPLSLTYVQNQLRATAPQILNQYSASSASADDTFNRWIIYMKAHFQKVLSDTKCAIVLTKMDIPQLQQMGNLAPGASDAQCRNFLELLGMQGLIAQSNLFSSVQCFAVSTLPGNSTSKLAETGIPKLLDWILKSSVL